MDRDKGKPFLSWYKRVWRWFTGLFYKPATQIILAESDEANGKSLGSVINAISTYQKISEVYQDPLLNSSLPPEANSSAARTQSYAPALVVNPRVELNKEKTKSPPHRPGVASYLIEENNRIELPPPRDLTTLPLEKELAGVVDDSDREN